MLKLEDQTAYEKFSIDVWGTLHYINVSKQYHATYRSASYATAKGRCFLVLSSHQRQVDRTLVGQVVKDIGCFDSLISALLVAEN